MKNSARKITVALISIIIFFVLVLLFFSGKQVNFIPAISHLIAASTDLQPEYSFVDCTAELPDDPPNNVVAKFIQAKTNDGWEVMNIYNNEDVSQRKFNGIALYSLCKTFKPSQSIQAKRSIMAILYDATRGIPNWVAYSLDYNKTNNLFSRYGGFHMDHALVARGVPQAIAATYAEGNTQDNNTYNKAPNTPLNSSARYATGHLMPANDSRYAAESLDASFSFANAVPQHPAMNSGVWRGLEKFINIFAKSKKVKIITGVYGVFTNGNIAPGANLSKNKIGDPARSNYQAIIPACFYKILYAANPGFGYESIAFLVPNINTKLAPWKVDNKIAYVISVNDLMLRMQQAALDPEQEQNYYFHFTLPNNNTSKYSQINWAFWGITNIPSAQSLVWYTTSGVVGEELQLKPYPVGTDDEINFRGC